MSRSLMVRLLESFFRRWYLYLVPVLLLGILGFLSVSGTKSKFESSGTFNVENTTILLHPERNGVEPTFGETPADTTSKRISATLGTDQFIKDVATRAGLDQALASGKITANWIRSSLSASANGSNLVKVAAVNEDPQIAQRLAQSTIDAYVQTVIDAASSQSTAAVSFFDDLIATYQGNVDQATKALNDYVASHPTPALGARPEDEQAELSRLNAALTQAQTALSSAEGKRQDAELSIEQTKADMGQQMRLIDAPALPLGPQAKLKTMIMSFATFLILGFILTIGALVVATVLNHTILSAADVKERLGVRLLAVVPEGSGKPVRPAKAPKVKAVKEPKEKAAKQPRRPAEAGSGRPAQVKQLPAGSTAGPAGRRWGSRGGPLSHRRSDPFGQPGVRNGYRWVARVSTNTADSRRSQ